MSEILPILVEAARRGTKVKLTYKDKERMVDGYSFREFPSGIAYFAEESGTIKAFLLSRIQAAAHTSEHYNPKWPVELAHP